MSLYVVEREEPPWDYWLRTFRNQVLGRYPTGPLTVSEVVDCNARDGEWFAVVTMAHRSVERWVGASWDPAEPPMIFHSLPMWPLGDLVRMVSVPEWEGDTERRRWEARRRRT